MVFKSGFAYFVSVIYVAPVDDEPSAHRLLQHAPSRQGAFLPFGYQKKRVVIRCRLVHVAGINDCIAQTAAALIHGFRVVDTDRASGFQ